jgi:hypothetical protein
MSSLDQLSVLNYAANAELPQLRQQLQAAGYRVLEFRGERIQDRESLFAAVSEDLLEGEPVANWSGLEDSLRNALEESQAPRIVLLWDHAQQMLDGALRDLVTMLDALTRISRRLYTDNRTFLTFLLGDGPNFQG